MTAGGRVNAARAISASISVVRQMPAPFPQDETSGKRD